MRGIFGSLGRPGGDSDIAAERESMARPFACQSASSETVAGGSVTALGGRTRVLRHGGLLVAIAGTPRLVGHDGSDDDLLGAIAEAYRRDPDGLPAALHGPFALAVLEPEAGRALLAVDRIGIEPLCYAMTANGLVFASRADSVAAHPGTESTVDPQGIFDYLYGEMVPAPRVIYRGQQKLLPAQCLRFDNGRLHTGYYWSLEYRDQPAPFEPLKREFLEVLEQSVARAAEGREPEATGCFLSGGTDSSSVAGMLTRVQKRPARCFSIGFASEGYDEMEFVRIAQAHFGLQSDHYYVTPEDVMQAIPRIAAAYDEPFGNASAVPTLFCAELAARHGMQTLLAGDGGDEIFGGNARYSHQLKFEMYDRVPGLLRRGLIEPLALGLPGAERIMPLRKLGSYIQQYRVPLPDRMEKYNFLHHTPIETVFTPAFLGQVDTGEPLEFLRDAYQRARSDSPLNRMLHLDMKITLADNDLRKVSRMCELAGVEVRYPMLDEAFVALSGRVPPDLKIRRFKLRYFFKKSLEGFLPKEILTKRKQGFGLPTGIWLRDHPALRAHADSRMEQLKQRDIIHPDYIDELLRNRDGEYAYYYGVMVWKLMMLEEWLQSRGL
jgi:asparagine synthase (glutamine-hydrolysing)